MLKNESFRYHMKLFIKASLIYFAIILFFEIYILIANALHLAQIYREPAEDYTFLFICFISFYSFFNSFPLFISHGYSRHSYLKGRFAAIFVWCLGVSILTILIEIVHYYVVGLLGGGHLGVGLLTRYIVFLFTVFDTCLYLFLYFIAAAFTANLIVVLFYRYDTNKASSRFFIFVGLLLMGAFIILYKGSLSTMAQQLPAFSWLFFKLYELSHKAPFGYEWVLMNVCFVLFFGLVATLTAIHSWRLTRHASMRTVR